MATIAPYNQIPKIPTKILDSLFPILKSKISLLEETTTDLQNSLLSLSANASCDDAEILNLKAKLAELQNIINQIEQIFEFLPQITGSFRFLIRLGYVISGIQIIIPAVPGVPQGPINQILTSMAELIQISESCIQYLIGVVNTINISLNKTSNLIANANNTIDSICNSNNVGTTNLDISIQLQDLEQQYPSDFYRTINVSDEDLLQRFQAIQTLIINEIDIITNLNEAPSKVLYGTGIPTSNIGQPGDYYINTENQTVYGPKVDSVSW